MSPRYLPGGLLGPDVLTKGAEDASRLGFRTIKLGLNAEVVRPEAQYYSLPDETIGSIRTIVDLAKLDVYRKVFAMPFQTYFLAADAIGDGNWESLRSLPEPGVPRPVDRPLTASAKAAIYRQLFDLTRHLLRTYGGTGKVFILQNHEADWHTLPTSNEALDPSDVALANTAEYAKIRQKAVDDARREVGAAGVYVYHLFEVNLVKKAMAGGKTVSNNVLPVVDCDLVGYSAWDTSSQPGSETLRAVEFLKTKVKPSFAFGRNNVVISELGYSERRRPEYLPELRAMIEAMSAGCPWVLQWALYDNECTRIEDGERVVPLNARNEECEGLWVRRPDGTLGKFFRAYQPYLDPTVAGDDPDDAARYTRLVYRKVLGRDPDNSGGPAAINLVETRPWDKEMLLKDLATSKEYRERTGNSSASFVFDCYRTLFGRDPEPGAVALMARDFRADADRIGFIDLLLKSDESRRRYIEWLYRRYLDRVPEPEGMKHWLTLLQRGQTRRQVHDSFFAGLPRE